MAADARARGLFVFEPDGSDAAAALDGDAGAGVGGGESESEDEEPEQLTAQQLLLNSGSSGSGASSAAFHSYANEQIHQQPQPQQQPEEKSTQRPSAIGVGVGVGVGGALVGAAGAGAAVSAESEPLSASARARRTGSALRPSGPPLVTAAAATADASWPSSAAARAGVGAEELLALSGEWHAALAGMPAAPIFVQFSFLECALAGCASFLLLCLSGTRPQGRAFLPVPNVIAGAAAARMPGSLSAVDAASASVSAPQADASMSASASGSALAGLLNALEASVYGLGEGLGRVLLGVRKLTRLVSAESHIIFFDIYAALLAALPVLLAGQLFPFAPPWVAQAEDAHLHTHGGPASSGSASGPFDLPPAIADLLQAKRWKSNFASALSVPPLDPADTASLTLLAQGGASASASSSSSASPSSWPSSSSPATPTAAGGATVAPEAEAKSAHDHDQGHQLQAHRSALAAKLPSFMGQVRDGDLDSEYDFVAFRLERACVRARANGSRWAQASGLLLQGVLRYQTLTIAQRVRKLDRAHVLFGRLDSRIYESIALRLRDQLATLLPLA
jgi:hypothetical protein